MRVLQTSWMFVNPPFTRAYIFLRHVLDVVVLGARRPVVFMAPEVPSRVPSRDRLVREQLRGFDKLELVDHLRVSEFSLNCLRRGRPFLEDGRLGQVVLAKAPMQACLWRESAIKGGTPFF